MNASVKAPTLFATARHRASVMTSEDVPRFQRFLEANPEYELIVSGELPTPDAAQREFEWVPPYPYKESRVIAFDTPGGELVGVAGVVTDLFAEHIWHMGLFMVATGLHGTGVAQEVYEGLETWMRGRGAWWLRLGVVAANERGGRFWDRQGFVEVRVRRDTEYGKLTHDVRVLVKALRGERIEDYLAQVERDRPESE